MTYPVGGAPDGSFRIGNVRDAQDLNEASVKSIIRGKNLPPWENAQGQLGETYARGEYVHREVVRLDNRIDTVADELGVLQIATFGFSGRWQKPPGAYGDIVFDILGPGSGGGRSNNGGSGGTLRGGLGGYSGGWQRVIIPAADCPAFLDMTVWGPAPGATSDGGSGSKGQPTQVRRLDGTLIGEATGGDSAARTYGTGNNTYRIRGGNGQGDSNSTATSGGAGSFDPGGKGSGVLGGEGENGFSAPAGKIGTGSGGGGGGRANVTGNGGRGGDGGWPAAPGGGGGSYLSFGFAGNGGAGAAGAVYVTTRINETRTVPPSVPSGLSAGGVTASGATITWTASTDDTRVTEYEVLVNNVVRGYTSSTAYILSGLSPSTAYAVKLRAVDENGNWSGFSSVLNFTTTA